MVKELKNIDEIRKTAIIAMFSDDELMETLVLKGGNAISFFHDKYSRSSMDLDFSMEDEISEDAISDTEEKINTALERTFLEKGYIVFDYKFAKRPKTEKQETKDFWKGYNIEFKLIEKGKHDSLQSDIDNLRRNSLVVGIGERRKFSIDISPYEYCGGKKQMELDEYVIYVYTPEMIVIEKIRAICQQMEEYPYGSKSPRARDFYDIYELIEAYKIDLTSKENMELIELIFRAKKVPLSLIGKINEYKEFHKAGFGSVQDTIFADNELHEFDYYFDYLLDKTKDLEILWKV